MRRPFFRAWLPSPCPATPGEASSTCTVSSTCSPATPWPGRGRPETFAPSRRSGTPARSFSVPLPDLPIPATTLSTSFLGTATGPRLPSAIWATGSHGSPPVDLPAGQRACPFSPWLAAGHLIGHYGLVSLLPSH